MATQYTLQNKSLDIYIAGCNGNPHCPGCHNPESWDFKNGRKYTDEYFKEISSKVEEFNALVQNIMIFGGEPLDQPLEEIVKMLQQLKTLGLPIWLFTRYEIELVPKGVKEFCDYIKCGRYIPELACDNSIQYGIKLATSNQKIYKNGIDFIGEKMRIKYIKLNPNAIEPTRGSEHAAGYDLHACLDDEIIVGPQATVKIPTGLSMELPHGYAGLIYARSGLATKRGLRPSNCVGVCDSDYRGEYIVALYNDSGEFQTIKPGDRIAQIIVTPFLNCHFEEVETLDETKRGDGGFGSTGE